ncbi:hypothetical protein PAMA_020341 [Pampus argenteus]
MGPNSMGGRYRVSTPVIQPCPPGGIMNSHTPRAPPLEELIPHRLAIHAGELYAPTSTQGSQVFPSLHSPLPAQLGLHPALPERNCSPNYGLDLSKKSPNSQSQHTPSQSHLANTHNDEERDGTLSGRTSPMQGTNGRAFPSEKMESTDQGGSLTPPPFLNQPLGPHLPHLHRSGSQGTGRYPCPPSPDTATEGGEGGREMGNIYRWVKHEPLSYTAEDEDEDEDEEEGGENGDRHHNHHKTGEESEGVDDKSGSGTEETGSSEGRPSPTGPMGRFHMPYEPESFGDNLYVCIPCDKGFPSSEQLNAHVETHTEEELYGNSVGELGNGNNSNTKNISSNTNGYGSMNSSNSLNSLSHLETKSSQGLSAGGIGEMIRPYRCSSCEKSYKDPATLRQHEKTHWLTRPYPCSICGKKFTQRGGLNADGKLKLDFAEGIYPLSKYTAEHLGLKQEKANELLIQAKAMDSLYPLSKLASEHLGLTHDKLDVLGQPLPPPLQASSEGRTIDRYSPS